MSKPAETPRKTTMIEVSKPIHKQVKKKADELGMKLYRASDEAFSAWLSKPKQEMTNAH
jgi:hypothetical protein